MRPVLRKNDFAKLKIVVSSLCRVTLRLRVKKANTLANQNTEFDKKCFKTRTQARRPLTAQGHQTAIFGKYLFGRRFEI